MKLSREDILAASILHWAKENGYTYKDKLWYKDGNSFCVSELWDEFKKEINI